MDKIIIISHIMKLYVKVDVIILFVAEYLCKPLQSAHTVYFLHSTDIPLILYSSVINLFHSYSNGS